MKVRGNRKLQNEYGKNRTKERRKVVVDQDGCIPVIIISILFSPHPNFLVLLQIENLFK